MTRHLLEVPVHVEEDVHRPGSVHLNRDGSPRPQRHDPRRYAASRPRGLDPHLLGLEQNPRPHGVKAMASHKGLFRVRVGDYRILYEIDDAAHVVTVTRVRLRGSAYRGL